MLAHIWTKHVWPEQGDVPAAIFTALPEHRPDMARAAAWIAARLDAIGCPEAEVCPPCLEDVKPAVTASRAKDGREDEQRDLPLRHAGCYITDPSPRLSGEIPGLVSKITRERWKVDALIRSAASPVRVRVRRLRART